MGIGAVGDAPDFREYQKMIILERFLQRNLVDW